MKYFKFENVAANATVSALWATYKWADGDFVYDHFTGVFIYAMVLLTIIDTLFGILRKKGSSKD